MIATLRKMRLSGLIALWAFALAFFAIRNPVFFSLANFSSILQFSTLLALVTFGQTLVILGGAGGIDLSVGGIVSLSGLSVAFGIKEGLNPYLASLGGIALGGLLGLINGLLITKFRLLPLIATLGAFYAYNGLSVALTDGAPIAGLPQFFGTLGQGNIALVAVFFFTSFQAGLQMLNVNAIWQLGFVGLFLIFSVLVDGFIRRGESM